MAIFCYFGPVRRLPNALSVIIGTSDLGNVKQAQLIETGLGRIKMSGVGNISSPIGREKTVERIDFCYEDFKIYEQRWFDCMQTKQLCRVKEIS